MILSLVAKYNILSQARAVIKSCIRHTFVTKTVNAGHIGVRCDTQCEFMCSGICCKCCVQLFVCICVFMYPYDMYRSRPTYVPVFDASDVINEYYRLEATTRISQPTSQHSARRSFCVLLKTGDFFYDFFFC